MSRPGVTEMVNEEVVRGEVQCGRDWKIRERIRTRTLVVNQEKVMG